MGGTAQVIHSREAFLQDCALDPTSWSALRKTSQAASAGAIICRASLEQQNEVSADLSGELLYLETLIGCEHLETGPWFL